MLVVGILEGLSSSVQRPIFGSKSETYWIARGCMG